MGWALALRCLWWLADWASDLALGAFLALQIFGQPQPQPPPAVTATPQPPARPPIAKPSPGGRRLVIRADSDNQCYVEARANGANFKFLIDTGASSVAFGPQHVRQLGLEPALLQYDRRMSTANGEGRAAEIWLREFRIGDFVLRNVTAYVDQGGLDKPLLGASVLTLLHLEYTEGSCILTLPRNTAAKVAGKGASALLEYDDGLAGFGKLY